MLDEGQEVTLVQRAVTEEAMLLEQLPHIVGMDLEGLFGGDPVEQPMTKLASEPALELES